MTDEVYLYKVKSLPETLEPNSIYFVEGEQSTLDMFVSGKNGEKRHLLNKEDVLNLIRKEVQSHSGTGSDTTSGLTNHEVLEKFLENGNQLSFGDERIYFSREVDALVQAKADQTALTELQTSLAEKADNTRVAALETDLTTKADQTQLETVIAQLATKADAETLTALQSTLEAKADKSQLDALTTALDGKVSTTDFTALQTDVGNKASNTDLDAVNKPSMIKLIDQNYLIRPTLLPIRYSMID